MDLENQKKRHRRIRKACFWLTVFLITGLTLFIGSKTVYADWVTINGGSNGIQEAKVDKTTIIQTGIHNAADDNAVRYKTVGYYMTLEQYDLDSSFTSGSNASIAKAYVPMDITSETVVGSTKKTIYTIQKTDFLKAIVKLGVTGEQLKAAGSLKVYLNNIFNVVQGSDDAVYQGKDNIFGYQEMLDAVSWSSSTQTYLKGYYNFEYVLSPVTYTVKVCPVDEDGNSLKGATNTAGSAVSSTLASKDVIYSESIDYTLNDANKTLTKDGTSYQYTYWYYSYTKSGGGTSTTDKKSTGISFDAPDAVEGSTLTVYLVYENQPTQYNVKVVAETADGMQSKVLKNATSVTSGSKYTYTIPSTLTTKSGDIYNYQYNCYLTYTKEDGTETTITDITSTIAINYTLPSAKENTTATFHVVYDKGSSPTPTSTPSPTTPTPTPTLTPIVIPEADSESLDFTTITTTGILRADDRGSEKFVATLGVPTTESLYAQVTAKEYLLGYNLVKKVGTKTFTIEVSRNYILQWYSATPDSAGGKKLVEETVTVTQIMTVERAYGYWEIENLECYGISSATISNYALQGGSVTLTPNSSYYSSPTVTYLHSEDIDDHVFAPEESINGIQLSDVVVAAEEGSETTKPTIPQEDFTDIADEMTGNATVKSDYLSFNGITIISNKETEMEAPEINTSAIRQCTTYTDENALYQSDNVIGAIKKNGTYSTYGTITYTKIAKVGSYKADTLNYSIAGLNEVVIHTPVICNPTIIADNDEYVQLINPTEGCVELVLDAEDTLSDFTVKISNTGLHSNKQGYYTRDFSKSIRNSDVSYIAEESGLLKNQVKFPFDVYIDKGITYDSSEDEFVKADTWITIGRSSPRFYLPMTVDEGVYSVSFRTIAVNGEDSLTATEKFANTQLNNYVATNTLKVEVSGRIYGLTIYDISDYPVWENVFRITDSLDFKKDSSNYTDGTTLSSYKSNSFYTYTLGTNNQYGNDTGRDIKYTFPLVNGSHPRYKNIGILKTGYVFRFMLQTTGNMFSDACKVVIEPTFYYVDEDGKNRVEVDLYYTESINNKTRNLVKVGSTLDQINLKEYSTGNLNLGIPETELKQTAKLRGLTYSKFIYDTSPMFNFSKILLNFAFRTYTNNDYLSEVKSYDSYSDATADGITSGDILERMQTWYGQYYLPNKVHAVEKGYDVMDYADKYGVDYSEDFWLDDGYIIVNFNIETVGEDGSRRLSYINYTNYKNNGNCSMWLLEGPVLTKTSNGGTTFNFYAGDVMIYYANKKMTDDYEAGAVY